MGNALKKYHVFIIDMTIVVLSIFIAYMLRLGVYNYSKFSYYYDVYYQMMPFVSVGTVYMLHQFGFYKNIWKYAGLNEYFRLLLGVSVSNLAVIAIIFILNLNVPKSIYIIATFIESFFLGLTRTISKVSSPLRIFSFQQRDFKRIMIIGAGEAGSILINKLRNNGPQSRIPVCFIDDDIKKKGMRIANTPVLEAIRI